MQESTLEAGRERDEALQQLEQERAQLQALAQSQQRMAQQLDAAGQELAATSQQLQQAQAWPLLNAAASYHPVCCVCDVAWGTIRAYCLLPCTVSVAIRHLLYSRTHLS